MAESPKSEYPSILTSAMEELDDHRHQPEFLPRSDTHGSNQSRTRRRTRRSTSGTVPSIHLQVPEASGTISRDFEQAIIDDDKSDQESIKETPLRRGTFRLRRNTEDKPARSRASSSSSSSDSPPNSVDAFAEPRKRARAETAASKAPSFITRVDPPHSPHERRRTLSEDKTKDLTALDSSSQGSVEDDVCYPPSEEPTKHYEIDFEDLEEFVMKKRTEPQQILAQQFINTKDSELFHHHGHSDHHHHSAKPDHVHPKKHPSESTNDGSDFVTDEKAAKHHVDVDFDEKHADPQYEHIPVPRDRWTFFSSELEEARHRPELCDLLEGGETFQDLFDLGPDSGVWWLDLLMPTKEEVEVICKAFNIHGLTREDIIQQEPREKVELFHTYYFLSFRSFYQEDKDSEHYMEPVSVFAVVFRGGVITFTFCPSPHPANVRRRIYKLRDYVALSSDWICYALIDDIVDSFAPVIRSVEAESEAIEDSVFTARAEDSRTVLRAIGETRKKIMTLLRLLGGKADVIKGFAKRCNEHYSVAPRQEVGLYLSDIQDHVVTMMGNLGHFEKILSRSHSNYLAHISVDNIQQGNRVSAALSKVTYIATILVPMNLVCSMFGMNVEVPGKNATGLAWWFGILGVLVFFAVISTALMRCRRLI